MGRDVSKLKGKGGGKFKYMAEKDMLELAAKFSPYRCVSSICYCPVVSAYTIDLGACSCGICGELRTSTWLSLVVDRPEVYWKLWLESMAR